MIGLADVEAAAARIAGAVHRTPVLTSRTLDERIGARLFLKAENLQRGGAFKLRGATNRIEGRSPEERERGVCAVSSGTHAQAVAIAAGRAGLPATILMPEDAPAAKLEATRGYGAEIVSFDRYGADREALVHELAAERGLTLVHPYDDPLIMAGQGTAALELLQDVPDLDVLVVPIGGGGLAAGCATAATGLAPRIRVVGVEPAASDDTQRSLAAGERVRVPVGRTIADGQQTEMPGALTFEVNRRLLDGVVTVSDEEIVAAIAFLVDRVKTVAEPSGACALAAVLAGRVDGLAGRRVGVVVSGGNVGAARLGELLAGYRGP
jgi:threonine dehydratase